MSETLGGVPAGTTDEDAASRRYVGWFHELDAWTEYWDIYQPQSRGRYYFGDGEDAPGCLTQFLPRDTRPAVWSAWLNMALSSADPGGPAAAKAFAEALQAPLVRDAILEVDALLERLFAKHFGAADDPAVQHDYLEGVFRFAIDTLPPATERYARIADDDPRKSTSGRHTLEGDLMWFAWAMHTEAAQALAVAGRDPRADARRALSMAGVNVGCAAQFAWKGHRRTRPEYRADAATARLLRQRGLQWVGDAASAAAEAHALYRIREFGSDA